MTPEDDNLTTGKNATLEASALPKFELPEFPPLSTENIYPQAAEIYERATANILETGRDTKKALLAEASSLEEKAAHLSIKASDFDAARDTLQEAMAIYGLIPRHDCMAKALVTISRLEKEAGANDSLQNYTMPTLIAVIDEAFKDSHVFHDDKITLTVEKLKALNALGYTQAATELAEHAPDEVQLRLFKDPSFPNPPSEFELARNKEKNMRLGLARGYREHGDLIGGSILEAAMLQAPKDVTTDRSMEQWMNRLQLAAKHLKKESKSSDNYALNRVYFGFLQAQACHLMSDTASEHKAMERATKLFAKKPVQKELNNSSGKEYMGETLYSIAKILASLGNLETAMDMALKAREQYTESNTNYTFRLPHILVIRDFQETLRANPESLKLTPLISEVDLKRIRHNKNVNRTLKSAGIGASVILLAGMAAVTFPDKARDLIKSAFPESMTGGTTDTPTPAPLEAPDSINPYCEIEITPEGSVSAGCDGQDSPENTSIKFEAPSNGQFPVEILTIQNGARYGCKTTIPQTYVSKAQETRTTQTLKDTVRCQLYPRDGKK